MFAGAESDLPYTGNFTPTFDISHPEVFECSFSICAKVFNASISTGRLSEALISEIPFSDDNQRFEMPGVAGPGEA